MDDVAMTAMVKHAVPVECTKTPSARPRSRPCCASPAAYIVGARVVIEVSDTGLGLARRLRLRLARLYASRAGWSVLAGGTLPRRALPGPDRPRDGEGLARLIRALTNAVRRSPAAAVSRVGSINDG